MQHGIYNYACVHVPPHTHTKLIKFLQSWSREQGSELFQPRGVQEEKEDSLIILL